MRSVDPSAAESVHLTDYPEGDPAKIDESLSRDMAAVLEVVSLGHAARQEAEVKVRQPLPAILVHSRDPDALNAIERLKDQILDELNVKELSPLTDPGQVVAYGIRPNLRVLGPKYGKRLGAIREALGQEEPASVAARVEAGQPIELRLEDGSAVALEPAEVLVDLTKRAGYAAAQSPAMTVVLDTSLTPELIQEGLARDFVRGVQDARKSAGYRIEDTIAVAYEADPEVVAALGANEDYVRTETLAVRLERREAVGGSDAVEPEAVEGPGGVQDGDGVYRDQIVVGRHQVRIGLRQETRED